jgi:predicted nucleic acid-binding protein
LAVYLFIDTNIFLSFYHLSGEDLEELNKLTVLLRKGEVALLLPEQVRDEFYRMRYRPTPSWTACTGRHTSTASSRRRT